MNAESGTLDQRLREARSRLAGALLRNVDTKGLAALQGDLDLLETMRRRRWRRVSLRWSVAVVAVVIAGAIVLDRMPLGSAEVTLAASTRALTLRSGSETIHLLPAGMPTAAIVADVSGERSAWCEEASPGKTMRCKEVRNLFLNGLSLNANSEAEVHAIGACVGVTLAEGGGRADITFATATEPDDSPRPTYRPLELAAGDGVRVCGGSEVSLHLLGIEYLMIGERTPGGPAEQRNVPALLSGSLSIPGTASVLQLRPTDAPQLGALSRAVLVARAGETLEVSFVGRARRISIATGERQQDAMPTLLDWVRNSPGLKAAVGLLLAIVGAAGALRSRMIDASS